MTKTPNEAAVMIKNWAKQNYGTQRRASEALGVSEAFLSAVILNRKSPSKTILDAVGLERITLYKKKPR